MANLRLDVEIVLQHYQSFTSLRRELCSEKVLLY
jgi:hypothetical protein